MDFRNGQGNFSVLKSSESPPGTHSASYLVGIEGSLSGLKRFEREYYYSSLVPTERISGALTTLHSMPSTPPQISSVSTFTKR
jgi:hypothetical protein